MFKVFAYEMPNGDYEIRHADSDTIMTVCYSIDEVQHCCTYNGWELMGIVFINPYTTTNQLSAIPNYHKGDHHA